MSLSACCSRGRIVSAVSYDSYERKIRDPRTKDVRVLGMRLFPTIRPNLHESWTHNRASISAWRWIGQKTLFSTGGEAVSDTGDQPASARTQQEDGEEQDTPRASQLQSASPPSSKLPLSPLMDPNLIAARQRYRTPKPAPSDELSAFSKKLKRNPFGRQAFLFHLKK